MQQHELELLHLTTAMRTEMMNTLLDADLGFTFAGNPTLGEVCRTMGDIQRSYIDSFKTLKLGWDVRNNEAGLTGGVAQLKSWYKALDEEMDSVLTAIPDTDFQTKMVDRGGNFMLPLGGQFHAYREALLIFYGKCSVYMRAMGKPLSNQWLGWIG